MPTNAGWDIWSGVSASDHLLAQLQRHACPSKSHQPRMISGRFHGVETLYNSENVERCGADPGMKLKCVPSFLVRTQA